MKRFQLIDRDIVVWEACQFTDGAAVALDYREGVGRFYDLAPETWPAPDEGVGWPRFFHLHRVEDETGNTGTGIVAEGVQFSDGTAVLRWLSDTPSFVVYRGQGGVEAVQKVHGHAGRTQVIFREDPP